MNNLLRLGLSRRRSPIKLDRIIQLAAGESGYEETEYGRLDQSVDKLVTDINDDAKKHDQKSNEIASEETGFRMITQAHEHTAHGIDRFLAGKKSKPKGVDVGILLSFVGAVVLTTLASYGAYAIYRDVKRKVKNED